VERLARKIAGDSADNALMMERATAVAEAQVDVARVQRAKVAVLDRLAAPLQETFAGSAEVVRRALSELVMLNRYERRAALRRHRAVRNLLHRTSHEA
jgi:hypothetical protein